MVPPADKEQMVGFDQRNAAKYRTAVQPHLDDEVLAAGYFNAAGTAKAHAFTTGRIGLVGLAIGDQIGRRSREQVEAVGFPPSVWIAVTAHQAHVFAAERGQVSERLATWERGSVHIEAKKKAATMRTTFTFDDGSPEIHLEARIRGAGNGPVLELLLDPARR
jgi:hypothetical protein